MRRELHPRSPGHRRMRGRARAPRALRARGLFSVARSFSKLPLRPILADGGLMPIQRSRRAFLTDVGRGVLVASVGVSLATELGLAAPPEIYHDVPDALSFGPLE